MCEFCFFTIIGGRFDSNCVHLHNKDQYKELLLYIHWQLLVNYKFNIGLNEHATNAHLMVQSTLVKDANHSVKYFNKND